MLRLITFLAMCQMALCAPAPISAGYLSVMDCEEFTMPCPSGMTCLYNRLLPGTRGCYNVGGDNQKRPGSCPLPATVSSAAGPKCTLNSDCGDATQDKKCCASNQGSSVCVKSVPDPSSVKVTILRDGLSKPGDVATFLSSIALIQSKGKNYIFDFGGLNDAKFVLDTLRNKHGLYPEDIALTVSSHGHPDHYNTVFADSIVATSGGFMNGSGLALKFKGSNSWQLNDDPDLTIMSTPGHSLQDISLVVTNEETMGSVGLVGDMVLVKNDDAFLQINDAFKAVRKSVACQVEWIVPGHDKPFQMDDEQKGKFDC